MVEVTRRVIVQVVLLAMVPFDIIIASEPAVEVMVALPQFDWVNAGVAAITTLVGSVSVNETNVSEFAVSVLAMLMVNKLVAPAHIVVGLKDLLTEGGRILVTFKVALAGLELVTLPPFPLAVSSPAGMVLTRFPDVVDVTSIVTVQVPGVLPDNAGTVA